MKNFGMSRFSRASRLTPGNVVTTPRSDMRRRQPVHSHQGRRTEPRRDHRANRMAALFQNYALAVNHPIY
jgi:hypothetical protein